MYNYPRRITMVTAALHNHRITCTSLSDMIWLWSLGRSTTLVQGVCVCFKTSQKGNIFGNPPSRHPGMKLLKNCIYYTIQQLTMLINSLCERQCQDCLLKTKPCQKQGLPTPCQTHQTLCLTSRKDTILKVSHVIKQCY